MRDIQVFQDFANFYYCFIQDFSKIAVPLTSILKTSLLLSRSQLGKIANKVNDKVIWDENKSTAFLFKKSKNVKSKKLTYVWNF